MRLLIITQKVNKNDPILGFFHRWIEEFAKNFEKIIVICLEEGEHHLPSNVSVFSLGKEKGKNRISEVVSFYKLVISKRNDYDAVFVHMNQIYLLLAGVLWEVWRKKIFFWYTHKSTPFSLRIVKNIPDIIFTASEESFRLQSDNVVVMGHGIDTGIFKNNNTRENSGEIKILTTGRVSPTKNIDLMIDVVNHLKKTGVPFKFRIAGDSNENDEYYRMLKNKVESYELGDSVEFLGSMNQDRIAWYCNWADILLNFSDTGSLDKSVLEAMACGAKVLTTNEAFKNIPVNYIDSKDAVVLASKITEINIGDEKSSEDYVVKNHNLSDLINKISDKIIHVRNK